MSAVAPFPVNDASVADTEKRYRFTEGSEILFRHSSSTAGIEKLRETLNQLPAFTVERGNPS